MTSGARVDGVLPYVELGEPDGDPVVAMPGLNDGLAPLFLDGAPARVAPPPAAFRHHRVLVLSYPRDLDAPISTRELAETVAAFLDDAVGGPAVVSGHSMGAMVAQHLAADRPELVRGLALTAAVAAAHPGLDATLRRWEQHMVAGRWRAFYDDALRAAYTGSGLLRRRMVLRAQPGPERPELVDRHLALSRACRAHDATGRLAAIRCPVLVVGAERDPIAPPDRARALAAGLADAEHHQLAGLAHGFPEQAPRRYAHLVERFVNGPLAGRR